MPVRQWFSPALCFRYPLIHLCGERLSTLSILPQPRPQLPGRDAGPSLVFPQHCGSPFTHMGGWEGRHCLSSLRKQRTVPPPHPSTPPSQLPGWDASPSLVSPGILFQKSIDKPGRDELSIACKETMRCSTEFQNRTPNV